MINFSVHVMFIQTDITVGFSQLSYTVREGGGTTPICISRLSGTLSRQLTLTLEAIEGTGNATCKLQ